MQRRLAEDSNGSAGVWGNLNQNEFIEHTKLIYLQTATFVSVVPLDHAYKSRIARSFQA